jgi:RNA polymerase sigma factor (sigma-70 family)
VARCRKGDESAWTELVERFSRYVYAIAVQAYRLSASDAEDVFQETFARLYERLDDIRDDAAVRGWLAQVARRASIDRLRAAQRESPAPEWPEETAVDAEIERFGEAMGVREALAALPEHCREILDRFFARDQSYRVIGEALDVPQGTIASRISRCLSKLKLQLE